MNSSTLRRAGGFAAVALTLSVSLAACGDSDSSASDSGSGSGSTTSKAGAQTFGDGCSAVPTSGPGSFDGMVQDPVATAASTNPVLKTLVAAVMAANLGQTLDTASALTVFAPDDDAFAKIPSADLNALIAKPKMLAKILEYHVVGKQLDPTAVVGTQTTLEGGTVSVTGDTSGMKVNDANVVCGNVPTKNATVYIIDSVLSPPTK